MKNFYLFLCTAIFFNLSHAQVQIGSHNYTTLKAAFDAINTGVETGAISILITGDTTEANPAILYESGHYNGPGMPTGSYSSIAISPSGTGQRTILLTGDNARFYLDGASNVTIDGQNRLTIANSRAQANTIDLFHGASNVTISNCKILGSSVQGIIYCSNSYNASNNFTITHCDLGPYDTNLPANGILVYMDNGTQTGLNIIGNNIYDFAASGGVISAGIRLEGRVGGFTIQNNHIYQTAPRSVNYSYGMYILLPQDGLQGTKFIDGNEIGSANALGTGTYTLTAGKFTGIFYDYPGGYFDSCTIQNNKIRNLSVTGGTIGTGINAGFSAIHVSNGRTVISGNTIGSQTQNGSIVFSSSGNTEAVGILKTGDLNTSVTDNTIGGFSVSGSGKVSLKGIATDPVNAAQLPVFTCNNNIIGGTLAHSMVSTATVDGTVVCGIWNENMSGSFNNNIIRNLTGYAAGTSSGVYTFNGGAIGIYNIQTLLINPAGLSGNKINNLSNLNPTAVTFVAGIYYYYGQGTYTSIEKNEIHSLFSATTNDSAQVYGIYCANVTPNIYNNMITLGNSGVGGAAIYGIRNNTGSESVFGRYIKNNSIYIGGTKSYGNSGSCAFYQSGGTTNGFDVLDNIFVNNRSNAGGTGIHTSIRADLAYYSDGGQYSHFKANIYYGNGNGYILGYNYSTPKTTLAQWNSWTAQGGNYGYVANPKFIDPTGTVPNLHISTSLPTMAEGHGDGNIGSDIDNETRSDMSPNDIGADAGNFIRIDQPNITALSATAACTSSPIALIITGTGFTGVTEARIGSTVFPITNASATSITITTGNTALSGNVFLTNDAGTGISSSVFTIYLPPSISISPVSASVCSNAITTFSVTAANAASYQWRRNGVNLTNTPPFSNVTTATLTITNPNGTYDGSTFDVIAYSPQNACTITSGTAALTVLPIVNPVIEANGPVVICAGTSVTLHTTVGYTSYLWSNGAVTPTITVNTAGNYSVTVTNGNNCSGTSAAMQVVVNANVTYYADSDSDTYGNPTISSVSCLGAPTGYVSNNTDCNDADNTKHQTYPFYADTDGDTYGTGNTVAICAVNNNTPPSNYSVNNTDCNDNNSAIYRSALLYTDVDGDGYSASSVITCYGASLPAGQYLASNGNDCDDTDPLKHQTYPFYADSDGDTYGAGNVVNICKADGQIAPEGYALNNTDCDDNNASKYRTYAFYRDNDADGYGMGGLLDVCAVNASPTSGYSLSNTDCDDNNPQINPNISEILYDGLDNNCDGQLDEGSHITTKLVASVCGAVLPQFNAPIDIITVGPEITRYRIKMVGATNTQIIETAVPQFRLTDYFAQLYAATFSISIELQRNGTWLGYYGDVCQVTMPSPTNGIYVSYAFVTSSTSPTTLYDMDAATTSPDFNGANLGVFIYGSANLTLRGQNKIYAFDGCGLTASSLRYRVYKTGETPGSFSAVAETYYYTEVLGGQVWQSTSESPNVFQGLVPGTYTLEIYSDADSCSPGMYVSNNGGANYKATFRIRETNVVFVTATAGTPSGAYTNLSAAFSALATGAHRGDVVVKIADDTVELASGAVLNGMPQVTSLRIEPLGHVKVSIPTVSTATNAVIQFFACNNVTIDGLNTADNSLTISSFESTQLFTPPAISAVSFVFGNNNSIKNCKLKGSSTYVYNQSTQTTKLSGQCLNLSNVYNFTVSGCDFGSTGRMNPVSSIYGDGDNVTISNNNIHDYFAEDVPSAGIRAIAGSSWTIANNRFYQTTPKAWNYDGSENAAILVMPATITNPGTAQGFTITGNTIGYATANQTGIYALTGNVQSPKSHFCGIHFKGYAGGAMPTVISNNTVASVALTYTTSRGIGINTPFAGILFESGVGTCNNNSIGSQDITDSLVYNAFNSFYSGSTEVYGILNTSSNPFTSNNNFIGSMKIDSFVPPVTYAMRSDSGAVWTANGNTIGGTTANSIQTTATMYGLYSNAPANLASNTIRNLKGSSVDGITVANTNTVARNFIHSLNGGTIRGIRVTGGQSLFKNNMIALGENANNAAISGFNDAGGNNSFYNNSIYIGGTADSGTSDSFGILNSGNGTRDYRNNIVVNNRSNSAATGKNYTVSVASNSGLTMNKNVYFGNASANTFGLVNNNVTTDLAAWQTAATQDTGSYFANPQYLNPTAATPDLHINPAIATAVESKGTALAAVTDDYDAESRAAQTPNDIGADAGNFILVPPTITGLSAASGCTGTSLTIMGTYLAETTQVMISGTSAVITNTTPTAVTVTIGTGMTGIVSVVSNGITVNSAAVFTVIPQIAFYADADNDGYGDAAVTQMACTAPAGYVSNNTDCAPSDNAKWQTGNLYVDADNDGFYNGNDIPTAVCYGTATPSGYVASIIGADCNDGNANINANHVEVLGNGADDNCDGVTDEVTVTSYIQASQCGTTLTNIANTIYAYQITGATGYRFEITNGATVRIFDTAANGFALTGLAGGVANGTTYSIRVAVKTNGFWRAYGAACSVTTPALPGTTTLTTAQCGSTLALLSTSIYCNQVTAASQYRFEVTGGVNGTRTYDSSTNRFTMLNLAGASAYATTYTVRVALFIAGGWQPYGNACTVTTPASPPTTSLIASQCGITISNSWASIYCNPVTEAAGYRFEVKNGAQTRFADMPTSKFSLYNLSGGPAAGTVYTIRVAVLYNGVYQSFGTACTVTTAAVMTRQTETPTAVFDVKSYPNPYADTFKLNLNTSSEDRVAVKVYDMLGRQIEAASYSVAELGEAAIGNNYPSGVYNIIVSQGEQIRTLRVVKR
jgi:hypothetical protein